jgi:hypothetical protein
MAFTDLHEEIEATFAGLTGQTAGLGVGGGYYVCHAPDSGRDRAEYKRKWQAAKRKKVGWRALEKRVVDPEKRKAQGRKKSAAYKARLKASPEGAKKLKDYWKAYHAANKEKLNARCRAWHAKRRLDAQSSTQNRCVDGPGKGR